jgi:copper chaperone
MKVLHFKTNINCASCVRVVRPVLDGLPGIEEWEVRTDSADKLLSITSDSLQMSEVQSALSELGFEAKPVL